CSCGQDVIIGAQNQKSDRVVNVFVELCLHGCKIYILKAVAFSSIIPISRSKRSALLTSETAATHRSVTAISLNFILRKCFNPSATLHLSEIHILMYDTSLFCLYSILSYPILRCSSIKQG